MNDDLRIRRGTMADLPVVMELFAELAEWQREWRVFRLRDSLSREMERRYRLALSDAPDEVLFLAEEGDGRVIGMAEASVIRPSSFSDDRAVELSSAFVRPQARRRGVARALTGAVAGFAGEAGVERITLRTFVANEPAVEAWKALGFEPRIVQMTAPVARLVDPGEPHPASRG
jgi:ribosomal protein S18 acetylase RimI-like enzyme